MNSKTHYDKMAESSTHFNLTMTTNQSRAVTDDSLQQKQLSSRPSGSAGALSSGQHATAAGANRPTAPPAPSSGVSQQHQYLVNENYDKSEAKYKHNKSAEQSKQRLNGASSNNRGQTKVTVEQQQLQQKQLPMTSQQQLCNKSTGAIPKHSKNKQTSAAVQKPSTNHLDEIVTLPLDDMTTVTSSTANKRNGKDLSLNK